MSQATIKFKAVGTSPRRHDGVDKVTGRANYGADFSLPGMLHGKVLRSPHPHAVVKSIDVRPALALDGVLAAVQRDDFPDLDVDLARNVIARKKVLYHGHAVAAVAATTAAIAQRALELIEVDYEILPHVTNLMDAMQPDAPMLGEGSNVTPINTFARGDMEAGFAAADVVLEREFDTATVHQGYIEPHACVASYQEDGQTLLWVSSQGHFQMRNQSAELLGTLPSKIRVLPAEIGGGFGGKIRVYLEPLAIRLSERSGRPVKMVMSREEVFRATGPAPGSHIRLKLGVTSAGDITAVEGELWYESGGFPGGPGGSGIVSIAACYDIANVHLAGYHVLVNKPNTAAYRAPASPNGAHAIESLIDEACASIQMDPLAFRLKNAVRKGARQVTGPAYPVIGLVDTIEAARAHAHYSAPLGAAGEGKRRGRGVACGWWGGGGGMATAHISILPDGTPALMTGRPDIGGSRAAQAIVLAEELGIDVAEIKPFIGDTDSMGHNGITAGSSTTYAVSVAVHTAAAELKRELCRRAALTWDVAVDQVEWRGGAAHRTVAPGDTGTALTLGEIAARQSATGGPLAADANVDAGGAGPCFGTHICDVEVDLGTGHVDVIRYTVCQDVGRAVHKAYVEGQLQGGAVQGIGWALHEEYIYNEQGVMENAGFLDYRMPVALDVPMIETVVVEVPNPNHPYGVRGVGENPIVPPLGAVANAVAAAAGARLRRLPMTPPRVLQAILGLAVAGQT
jgi:CO/xanthine dehydrogenase Mo-binding subunit